MPRGHGKRGRYKISLQTFSRLQYQVQMADAGMDYGKLFDNSAPDSGGDKGVRKQCLEEILGELEFRQKVKNGSPSSQRSAIFG